MISPHFTPLASLAGGALLGVAASGMLLGEGRVAGVSGIVGGLFAPRPGDVGWRVAFVLGLGSAGLAASVFAPAALGPAPAGEPWRLVLAGLLVGVGTRIGNGCTSGHGVCGLSRASPRSLGSVMTFMTVGVVVAVLASRLGRGT